MMRARLGRRPGFHNRQPDPPDDKPIEKHKRAVEDLTETGEVIRRMRVSRRATRGESKWILIPMIAYSVASVVHYLHNAFLLDSYPNMPRWVSHTAIYSALLAVIGIGLLGYLVYVLVNRFIGLLAIAVYAMFGFDGLAHYYLAPLSGHTIAMNVTILSEAAAALMLLVVVGRSLGTPYGAATGFERRA